MPAAKPGHSERKNEDDNLEGEVVVVCKQPDWKTVDNSRVPMVDINNSEVRELHGEEDIKIQAKDVEFWIDPPDSPAICDHDGVRGCEGCPHAGNHPQALQ